MTPRSIEQAGLKLGMVERWDFEQTAVVVLTEIKISTVFHMWVVGMTVEFWLLVLILEVLRQMIDSKVTSELRADSEYHL